MPAIHWNKLSGIDQFDEVLEKSRERPVLVYKHRPTSPESISIKKRLEEEWSIPDDQLDLYLLDESKYGEVSKEITDSSGVEHESPQVLLYADGVTMYDESHDMINVKKIKIALKIINRTFKWMESRA